MKKLYAAFAVALVAALMGVMAYKVIDGRSTDQFANCRTSKIASGTATIGGPFTLVNKRGQTVTNKDVLTKPSLVYFGYTYCPDICPADAARNAEAVDDLAGMGFDVKPVFISIDPERDTPKVVGEFAGYMHEKMVGLTGSPAQVKAAAQAYKVYYRKNGSGEDYLMDHSTFTYLTLPKHGFVEFFNRDMSAKAVAEAVQCFLKAT